MGPVAKYSVQRIWKVSPSSPRWSLYCSIIQIPSVSILQLFQQHQAAGVWTAEPERLCHSCLLMLGASWPHQYLPEACPMVRKWLIGLQYKICINVQINMKANAGTYFPLGGKKRHKEKESLSWFSWLATSLILKTSAILWMCFGLWVM